MSELPKIAKPRPVKWGKLEVICLPKFWCVTVRNSDGTRKVGPAATTKAAAIRAWNKQESKR